ncbi:MICOS complex subunit MIC60 [Olea europaea subsp. europaea]|uniref:MICOS complex subunit MIC60 n=1 Tax=Olea europaea subsp. europaea TaxID=158383 RepID=A0A8S0TSP7_OLEEU|nr:MICOS complex subunit MIC60 [Olea europaea subsp. europaea]
MLHSYLEGIDKDYLLDLVLSSLPEDTCKYGTDTVSQLNHKASFVYAYVMQSYIFWDNVAPQFHAERLGTPEEGISEDETSDEAHEGSGTSGEEELGADDSGETEGEDSEDYDSGDSDAVPASVSTTTTRVAAVDPDPRQSDCGGFADYAGHHPSRDGLDKDMEMDRYEGDRISITEEHMEPCSDEQDMQLPTGTESLQGTIDIAYIQPCPDDHPVPVPTRTEEVQAQGGHHPSLGNRGEEQDMLPIGTEHLQDTADIKPCPDNDPMPVPTGTNEVQGIPLFIED